MLNRQIDGVRFLSFESLAEAGAVNAIFSRHGGVSRSAWVSLNVGGTVGDDPQHVRRNREITFQSAGLAYDSLYDVWQVHGNQVVCAEKPRPPDQPHLQADAILTDQPGVSLFMRFADCTPVLLADPVRGVVGLVHAGWQGTVKRTVQAALERLCSRYGAQMADVRAVIGPSIGPDHYEVGAEVIARVRETFGNQAGHLLQPRDGFHPDVKSHLDLWAANRMLLEEAGVKHIETAGICTACCVEDWYSHRAEHGRTGRFGAIIALEPDVKSKSFSVRQ